MGEPLFGPLAPLDSATCMPVACYQCGRSGMTPGSIGRGGSTHFSILVESRKLTCWPHYGRTTFWTFSSSRFCNMHACGLLSMWKVGHDPRIDWSRRFNTFLNTGRIEKTYMLASLWANHFLDL